MSSELKSLDPIVSLAKRRGFIFPGSEIYGGLANSWDYGPLGVELKNNIKQLWWKRFVQQRDDMVGIDAALIMNPKVWEASGHVSGFTDPLVECKKCNNRFRADHVQEAIQKTGGTFDWANMTSSEKEMLRCSDGKPHDFMEAKNFNLLFKTFIGPVEDATMTVYLRGEIAQAMFVDFRNVLASSRVQIPFGIASQGRVFRNEITPGNYIFRTREFDLMEFEYFIRESEWEKWFEYWRKEMLAWLEDVGADMSKVHEHEIPDGERAHYSKRTIDFEFDYPFGQKELYGLAYRTDFDLKNHMEKSGLDMNYTDPVTGEKFVPHVVEPSFGLDRTFLVVILSAYKEEGEGDDKRVYLKLPPKLAPYKAAVFPLLKNKPELVAKAKEVYDMLRKEFMVAWDDRGNIGKRYYSQDEIGTPYCITIDFDTLGENPDLKDTVTIRDRDTGNQERIAVSDLESKIRQSLK